MKEIAKKLCAACALTLFALASLAALTAEEQAQAEKVLDETQKQYDYGERDLTSTVTLIVDKPNKPQETMQFKMFQRYRTEQFTMVQIAPEQDKGSGYFWEDENLWFYDPISRKFSHRSTKETIGNSNSNTSDVSKQRDWRDDYTITDCKSGTLGKYPVWIITLDAKTSIPSYARTVYHIRKDIALVLKQEDFSTTGRLMRTALIPKYARIDGNYVATQMILRDEVNKGEQTQQIVTDFSFAPLPDKVFTKAYLEQLN